MGPSPRTWKLVLGALCIPAIGFIVFRVSMLGLLLLITLAFIPFERDIDEFPQLPLWIDLASFVVSFGAMLICGRALARFGAEPHEVSAASAEEGEER